jgi:ADP-ribose pyrophosphatase YjhB (NUDIX family)
MKPSDSFIAICFQEVRAAQASSPGGRSQIGGGTPPEPAGEDALRYAKQAVREEVEIRPLFSFFPDHNRGWTWHLVIPSVITAPAVQKARDRLPWRLRASPSATLYEIRYINGCGYIDT